MLATGTTLGSGFTGAFTPRFGVDGLSAFFLGVLGLVAAPTLAFATRYFEPGRRGRAISAPDRPVRARPRRGAVRPRPAHVPRRLGADDAAAGRDHPRLAQRRRGAPHRLPLPRGHASRRSRNVGRRAARGTCRRARLERGDRAGLRAAGRNRAQRPRRHGHEGRRDADAQLAPARPPDRARARLGADERRHDQGGDLRARARARRLARPAAALDRRPRARARCALGASAVSSTRSSSTT